jgi:hypothetical protein
MATAAERYNRATMFAGGLALGFAAHAGHSPEGWVALSIGVALAMLPLKRETQKR